MVFAERSGVIVIGLHRDVRAATTSSERVTDQQNNKVCGQFKFRSHLSLVADAKN
jgi:hypothetical protein